MRVSRSGRLLAVFSAMVVGALLLLTSTPLADGGRPDNLPPNCPGTGPADLAAAMAGPSSGSVGAPVTYATTLRNNGPGCTAGTALLWRVTRTIVGANPRIVSFDGDFDPFFKPPWTQPSPTALSCRMNGTAPGGSVSLRVTVVYDRQFCGSGYAVTATSESGDDTNPSNDSATNSTVIGSCAGVGGPPTPTGSVTGRVLLNGLPFTGGPIPYRSRIDVTNGRLTLTTDVGTLTVYGGGVSAIFVLTRTTERGKPLVQLRLVGGDFSICRRARTSAGKRAPPRTTVRRLWGKGNGRFRTRGRYASTTVRGTFWLTADRCDGTFVLVRQGKVEVFSFQKRKRVLLTPGKSYLAPRPHS